MLVDLPGNRGEPILTRPARKVNPPQAGILIVAGAADAGRGTTPGFHPAPDLGLVRSGFRFTRHEAPLQP